MLVFAVYIFQLSALEWPTPAKATLFKVAASTKCTTTVAGDKRRRRVVLQFMHPISTECRIVAYLVI
jgi:hypothetical protein